MNRRNFLKTSLLVAPMAVCSAALVKFSDVRYSDELLDLFSYIEGTKNIFNPRSSTVTNYKLLPYQKEMLKFVHENQNVLILKSRQIGFSTMVAAAYLRWLDARNSSIVSPMNLTMQRYILEKHRSFPFISRPNKTIDDITVHDEHYPTITLLHSSGQRAKRIVSLSVETDNDLLRLKPILEDAKLRGYVIGNFIQKKFAYQS
jgi:hypothetical protein